MQHFFWSYGTTCILSCFLGLSCHFLQAGRERLFSRQGHFQKRATTQRSGSYHQTHFKCVIKIPKTAKRQFNSARVAVSHFSQMKAHLSKPQEFAPRTSHEKQPSETGGAATIRGGKTKMKQESRGRRQHDLRKQSEFGQYRTMWVCQKVGNIAKFLGLKFILYHY